LSALAQYSAPVQLLAPHFYVGNTFYAEVLEKKGSGRAPRRKEEEKKKKEASFI